MNNVDVEIYISNLINFFENNPNDLMVLVGQTQKELFFKKLRLRSEKNVEEGSDFVLTKQQIIDIVVEMKIHDKSEEKINTIVQKTNFGDIFLN
jgi:hypothetical protein